MGFRCFFSLLTIWISACFCRHIFDPTNEFMFGEESYKISVHRLIGNDMPPLQTRGQLRWNTEYTLRFEPRLQGADKRWVLNHIWNETEFTLLYTSLLLNGVNRRDILLRCFDLDKYSSYDNREDMLLYLTAQNDGRNAGILDSRKSGYEWSVILDGNTFITKDSWTALSAALEKASKEKKRYLKVPYHRVHSIQDPSWLNMSTSISTVIQFAPTKGESQMAFHRDAKELFTLGDTNADAKQANKKKGYGQRNKSYLFKEGQLCAKDSTQCACANVFEGNEEDLKDVTINYSYTEQCGLVLRLWNYPTDAVIYTGLASEEEEGFFYFLSKARNRITQVYTECRIFDAALHMWINMSERKQDKYRTPAARQYKTNYNSIFLTESCFRARDREIAQNLTSRSIDLMIAKRKYQLKYNSSISSNKLTGNMCSTVLSSTSSGPHFLTVFDNTTLWRERYQWTLPTSSWGRDIRNYISSLMKSADKALTVSPFAVTSKKRSPVGVTDKRYYYSGRPFQWHPDDLTPDLVRALPKKALMPDKCGTVKVDGMTSPTYAIGSVGDALYDRAAIYYTITNVTTLALAGYYSQEPKYHLQAASMVDSFFISESSSMIPSLEYARDGDFTGVMDIKDFYYLPDAFTLLEQSGALNKATVAKLEHWCARLSSWLMQSKQGREAGLSEDHLGLYFDLTVLSLAVYGRDESNIDFARNRLLFRLSREHPSGHFALNGDQPFESSKNNSLNSMTFNLAGWVHVAAVNEAVRSNFAIPSAIRSLWSVKHKSEEGKAGALPVLLKAIRWLLQFLPEDNQAYTHEWSTKPAPKLSGNLKVQDAGDFQYDRLLEILRYGIQMYGLDSVFQGKKPPPAALAALLFPVYSTNVVMQTDSESTAYHSGARIWPALGLPTKQMGGLDSLS